MPNANMKTTARKNSNTEIKTTNANPITKTETENKTQIKTTVKTKTSKYNYMLRAVLALRLREPKIQSLSEGPETSGLWFS